MPARRLVIAWSQVQGLAAFYAIWIALGLVLAAVLYEPAFTVLAKHFPVTGERRRAMTAMTLVAALASFIFGRTARARRRGHPRHRVPPGPRLPERHGSARP
jgi:hypothetical protein